MVGGARTGAALAGAWLVLALATGAAAGAGPEAVWTELEPGLETARFDVAGRGPDAEGELTVLRVDPARFGLRVLTARDQGDAARPLGTWCAEFDLLAAVNAGMYQADRRTHVGFCQVDGRVLNRSANDYLSAAAFGPRDPADPAFRIFDLDETPLDEVRERYATVVQNLRLIKRPGENRWQPAVERWQEAALAEDGAGRALVVYCRAPLSMHELNALLLDLPLDVVAAQHLEGRNQARLHLHHPAHDDGPTPRGTGPELPNVLGVVRRPGVAPVGAPERR